jgi:hypothetical protein
MEECMNTKHKLFKINAALCFNKICRNSQLTLIYVNIKNIVCLVCVIKEAFTNMEMRGMEYFKPKKVFIVPE